MDLSIFWESVGENTFWRVGANIIRRLSGGKSRSAIAGVTWYSMNFDVQSTFFPVYFGFKAGVGETASVYGGGGVNYFKTTSFIGGTNLGPIPSYFLGQAIGMNPVVVDGAVISGPVIGENLVLTSEGFGMNYVFGVDKKLESGSVVFFEIEDTLGGDFSRDHAKTSSVATALAAKIPFYTISGNRTYRFGYKMPM